MTPPEIDEYVHGRLAAGGNLYTLHKQALAELQPDLILTQDLCAVCALPSGQVEAALGYLGCHAQVLSLDPRTLEQVLGSILAAGQATAVAARAERRWPGCVPGSPPWRLVLRGGPGRRSRWSSGWTRRSPPGTG
jgi:iron complex transport system substrate-binding protein